MMNHHRLSFTREAGFMAGLLLIAITVMLSGCRTSSSGATTPRKEMEGVRFASSQFTSEHAARQERVVTPFGFTDDGASGTEVVLTYLRNAQARGARYVSDMTIYMIFRYEGEPMECRTRVLLGDMAPDGGEGEPVAATPENDGPPDYSTEVVPFRPRAAMVEIEEREYVCKERVDGKVVTEAMHDHRHDVTAGRYIYKNPEKQRIKAEAYEECTYHTVKREAVRYSHQIALKFVPADWERISGEYSDLALRESDPVCYRLTEHQEIRRKNRVEGTLSYVGEVQPEIMMDGYTPAEIRRGGQMW